MKSFSFFVLFAIVANGSFVEARDSLDDTSKRFYNEMWEIARQLPLKATRRTPGPFFFERVEGTSSEGKHCAMLVSGETSEQTGYIRVEIQQDDGIPPVGVVGAYVFWHGPMFATLKSSLISRRDGVFSAENTWDNVPSGRGPTVGLRVLSESEGQVRVEVLNGLSRLFRDPNWTNCIVRSNSK